MKKITFLLVVILLTGCAVGNKYSYQASQMALPVTPEENKVLVLLVTDLRPYILSGDKPPDFVGLQRGGFGNPFDVTTTSGRPMTDDMSAAIANGLLNVGYEVIDAPKGADLGELVDKAINSGASRIVVLNVKEWKSDIYMSVTLHCDLHLSVYHANGDLMAENSTRFIKEVGGAQIGESKNSDIMADEFAKRIGYLFNSKEIKASLN